MKKIINYSLVILFFNFFFPNSSSSTPTNNYVDVHMHLNARQPGMGPRGPGQMGPGGPHGPSGPRQGMGQGGGFNFEAAAEGLIQQMDALGISKVVLMPPPQAPSQKGGYTHQPMLAAVKSHPGRLTFLGGGGELNPLIVGTAPDVVTESVESEFKSKAEQILRDGAKGFGEMMALHFSFGETHQFEQADPDHPLFLLLADIAAQNNVPIDLHMEVIPSDQPLPVKLIGRSSKNPSMVKANVAGFERLLAHNHNARIVWQHVSWDNTGHKTVAFLRDMLSKHSNLFMALKFVRPERETFNAGNEMFDDQMKLRPEWLQLFKDYPDRFVMGADEFVGPAGQPRHVGPPSFADTWSLMGQLPENLRVKIGAENAIRIYRL